MTPLASRSLGGMAAALALVSTGALLSPASAASVDSGTFDFPSTGVYDDCGFEIAWTDRLSGAYTVKDATPKTDGQFFRLQQKATYSGTFTNTETGDFFTEYWRTTFKEMPATPVEGQDGVVTYRTHETGLWDTIRDSSGKVRYRSAGNFVNEYVFDTGNDSAPGGTFIAESFVGAFGRFDTLDADFCAVAQELIG